MNLETMLLCLAGVFLVTYASRALPLLVLKADSLPEKARTWLSFVPVAVLAALVGPELLLHEGRLALSPDNLYLLAALPTLLVAWKTKHFFITIATGMACVALLRMMEPFTFPF